MAKDTYHDAVRRAIEKEGWTITAEEYYFTTGDAAFSIDLFSLSFTITKKKLSKNG